MAIGSYRDLFVVIATAAATLIGLLFVALSVSESRGGTRPKVVRQFRAAASFVAFINPLAVTLFGLVPGTNVGYPALALGASGLLFTAAGVRRTLELPFRRIVASQQPFLVTLLLLVFGFEFAFGIVLIVNVRDTSALANIGNILIVSLLIGIARAWELVGDWNTGMLSSIILLLGPAPNSEDAGGAGSGPNATVAEDLGQAPDDQPGVG
jgi:hypothetical protein